MNKTSIEWCDYTWNPVTGCYHGCSYCYARKISMRFQGHFNPEFHEARLLDPLKTKKPSRIFLGSMTDTFGSWVKWTWLNQIFNVIKRCPQHTFLTLTKCPENILQYVDMIPQNLWLGTSVDKQINDKRIFNLWKIQGKRIFISFEPLLEEIDTNIMDFDWIIIGGQTNPDIIPKKEWVDKLVKQARENNIPVFIKSNCHYSENMKEIPSVQEKPKKELK